MKNCQSTAKKKKMNELSTWSLDVNNQKLKKKKEKGKIHIIIVAINSNFYPMVMCEVPTLLHKSRTNLSMKKKKIAFWRNSTLASALEQFKRNYVIKFMSGFPEYVRIA